MFVSPDTQTPQPDQPPQQLDQQRIVVLRKPEVFVYQANPPEAEGYKASTWTNLLTVSPLRVSVANEGKDLYISLPNLPEPLTETHFTSTVPLKRWFEKAFDSSRAYALRANTSSTDKRIWLGLMFRSREDSYDFESVLHLYVIREENVSHRSAGDREFVTQLHTLITQPKSAANHHEDDQFLSQASATFAADLPPPRSRHRNKNQQLRAPIDLKE